MADGIVAVAVAAPAPVDVEQAAVVAAVANETMATRRVAARIDDGTAGSQFASEGGAPAGGGVVLDVDLMEAGFVFEIVAQHIVGGGLGMIALIVDVGVAHIHIILHLECHAQVVHQGGHFVDFGRGARAGQGIGHQAPVIGGGAKVGTLGGVGRRGVGV